MLWEPVEPELVPPVKHLQPSQLDLGLELNNDDMLVGWTVKGAFYSLMYK